MRLIGFNCHDQPAIARYPAPATATARRNTLLAWRAVVRSRFMAASMVRGASTTLSPVAKTRIGCDTTRAASAYPRASALARRVMIVAARNPASAGAAAWNTSQRPLLARSPSLISDSAGT